MPDGRFLEVASALAGRLLPHRIEKTESSYDIGTFRTLAAMRKWQPEDVIFDVGANDGRTILRWRRHLPVTRIFAFEPVRSTFDTLVERTADLPDVRLFRCALGAAQERRQIFLNNLSALNSFYSDWTSSGSAEEVEVDTLDAVIAREGVRSVELLKIDAEGHDLEVLKGAANTLSDRRIGIIQVEAGFDTPGKSAPSLCQFQDFLSGYGYFLHAVTNQCRATLSARTGSPAPDGSDPSLLVYCDAIFVAAQ